MDIGTDVKFRGVLSAIKYHKDGTVEDRGVVSTDLLTTNGAKFITDLLAGDTAAEMRYHESGTGGVTTAVGVTNFELDTAVSPKVTGSKASATAAADATYTSVGTILYAGAFDIDEWGLFSLAGAGTGVMLDRATFTGASEITVGIGDSIQFTYTLTIVSGQ